MHDIKSVHPPSPIGSNIGANEHDEHTKKDEDDNYDNYDEDDNHGSESCHSTPISAPNCPSYEPRTAHQQMTADNQYLKRTYHQKLNSQLVFNSLIFILTSKYLTQVEYLINMETIPQRLPTTSS